MMTITEKILARAAGKDHVAPGESIWVKADVLLLNCGLHDVKTDPKTGNIVNAAYGWGYADNRGSDCEAGGNTDAAAAKCFFDISNAVNADGTAAELQYIDFIKVQTGVNHFTAALGEVSTEVLGFADETL